MSINACYRHLFVIAASCITNRFILNSPDCFLPDREGTSFEPRHEISNNLVFATSKASDQPAHTHSVIRAFASRLNIL